MMLELATPAGRWAGTCAAHLQGQPAVLSKDDPPRDTHLVLTAGPVPPPGVAEGKGVAG